MIARLNIEQEKIEANLDLLMGYEGKFITYSEAIEIVDKIRKGKPKKSADRSK